MNRLVIPIIASLPIIAFLLSVSTGASGGTTLPSLSRTDSESCVRECARPQNKPVQLALVFREDDRRVLNDRERRRFNSVGIQNVAV